MPAPRPLPAERRERHDTVAASITAFGQQHLDAELTGFVHALWLRICRRKDPGCLGGQPAVWAAAVTLVIARINFLFDPNQPVHLKLDTITGFFGTNKTTTGNSFLSVRMKDGPPRMEPFYSRLGALAARETWGIIAPPGHPTLPTGEYAFVEFYCADASCDCRRVLLQVWPKDRPGNVLATINYGWEKLKFYQRWTGSREDARVIVGACLDPLNPQGPHAATFLGALRHFVRTDPAWPARFKQHYKLFKAAPLHAAAFPVRLGLPG